MSVHWSREAQLSRHPAKRAVYRIHGMDRHAFVTIGVEEQSYPKIAERSASPLLRSKVILQRPTKGLTKNIHFGGDSRDDVGALPGWRLPYG